MLYVSLVFFMVLPLLGVMAMEAGELSPFLDEPGSPNGASLAYGLHLLGFFTAFVLVIRSRKAEALPAQVPRTLRIAPSSVDRFGLVCIVLFGVLAALMLFAYGGIQVLTLDIAKDEFRVSLGTFGALMTLATKWLMPAFFAALVLACSELGWTLKRRCWVAICAACLGLLGASWGFKTTVLQMLLPAFILIGWRLRPRLLILIAVFFAANVMAFSLFFDKQQDVGAAVEALALRLTALQGDLAWYTWNRLATGGETPDYLKTFLPILGDGLLRQLTGADPARDYAGWASYYFGPAMTLFGGYPVEGLEAGASNQPTMFAESLVVGGRHLFVFVSALFGAVAGLLTVALRSALHERRLAAAATWATFFSFAVLSWTLGNGIASLLYLINLVGAAVTYGVLHLLLPRARRRFRKDVPG